MILVTEFSDTPADRWSPCGYAWPSYYSQTFYTLQEAREWINRCLCEHRGSPRSWIVRSGGKLVDAITRPSL